MKSKTSEYNSWKSMKARCLNKNHDAYSKYGGRGITICHNWIDSFDRFLSDMGPRPIGTSLDRIDNEKGYYPENCRWADSKQQNNNQRTNHIIEYNGCRKTLTQWAEYLGIKTSTLHKRLNLYGKTKKEAFTRGTLRPWRHGTRAGYENHNCRCDECRESNNRRHVIQRARRRQRQMLKRGLEE